MTADSSEIVLPDAGPLVSVIIPTYNRAHVIADALASVFAQTYRTLQVIIIDDGSTDATERVVQPFRDRLSYCRTPNGGAGAARNEGMRRATGEYVAWLDSDDVWAPEKLALQVAVLERHPEVVLVSSDFWAFAGDTVLERSHITSYYGVLRREAGGIAGRYRECTALRVLVAGGVESVPLYVGSVRDALVSGNWIHPPTVLMRRNAAVLAGEIDPTLANAMEYGFFIRLAGVGPFAYLDRSLLGYRRSDDQLSRDENMLDIRRSVLRTIEAIGPDALGTTPRDRSRYRRRLANCHLGLAVAAAERQERREAVTHLAASARLGLVNAAWLKGLVKTLLPRGVLGVGRALLRRPS